MKTQRPAQIVNLAAAARRMGKVLLVTGDSNVDMTAFLPRFPGEGDDVPLGDLAWSSGGAGVNVATAFARLGGAARLLSRVGSDSEASTALSAAERAGVDLSAVQRDAEHRTGVCSVLVSPGGERTFLSYRGANAFLTAPPPEVWRGVRRVHVGGHAFLGGSQRATALALCAEAKARNLPVSVDLCLPWIEREGRGVIASLAQFDIVFSNEPELRKLAFFEHGSPPRAASLQEVIAALGNLRGPLLVVKRGARGSVLVVSAESAAPSLLEIPPFAIDAVDTTGAGDAYVAAYLFARLSGAAEVGCARLAGAAGALQASRAGSADALPSRSEVASFLAAKGAIAELALVSGAKASFSGEP